MNDNGPYTQPPQFPEGEGGSGGQQPPYGGYGQPGPDQGAPPPGQPYGSGPYQPPQQPYPQQPQGGPYGDPSGGQPGYGPPGGYGPQHPPPQFQQPADQQMFSGGQPPYGPGGPGGPMDPGGGYPPPKKSNAGLFVVIGGGAVIVVLVIAVLVVLLRNPGEEPPAAGGGSAPEPETSQAPEEEPTEDSGGEQQQAGGPPYALPEEPCSAVSEDTLSEHGIQDGSKNLTDSSSNCSWYIDGEGETYGSLSLSYETPYGGSDSVEGAKEDFRSNVDYATDEDNSYSERTVHNQEDVDLGDEAVLVFSTEVVVNTQDSVATMLVRKGNMNLELRYSLSPGLSAGEDTPAPLEFSDVEGMMHDLGEESLAPIGG
ncbi:DUF3558 domain-containing protein [Streptomonospora algeriensis]|uniref:DUF3558 domain-containing protein n=1 Tax=Streptomonospora algeriensis TaxID=995084 RepID=A0ABW3BEB4_9ACTN